MVDDAVVFFEDVDDLLVHFTFLGDFFPERFGSVFNFSPFARRHRAQLQLVAVGSQRGFTTLTCPSKPPSV